MADEATGDIQAQLTALQAEVSKQKELTQTWMGKATDYEKKLGNKSIESLIEAAKERDILAEQAASGDPKKMQAEIDRRVGEVRAEFAPQLQERDKKLETTNSRLKEMLIVDKVFSQAGGQIYPKAADDFRNYIRTHCDINDNDEIVVKDSKGAVRYSAANASIPMTVTELIKELSEQRDHWFVNQTLAGGRTTGEKVVNGASKISLSDLNGMDPAKQREVLAKLSLDERLELARGISL